MPPLPGWDHPVVRRRRDVVRAALTSLPSPAKRASAAAATVGSLLPRLALWLAIVGLVVLFAVATDAARVAVVAVPAATVAVIWRQLSWSVRALALAGLLWLSLIELGPALGLGLDALLLACCWLPAHAGAARTAAEAPPRPATPEIPDLVPGGGAYDHPVSIHVPASLRRFAEERRLSHEELAMLASIRFPGDPPRTAARWQHIYNAIRLSRWLDKEEAS
jgi:hypothetical protein